jgi:transaldolase
LNAFNEGTPSSLRLLVDTADVSTWERLLPLGVFYGVTTNPKLIHQAGLPCTLETLRSLAQQAFELGANEIHLQVWGETAEDMLALGRRLAALDRRVMVKVPGTRAGMVCTRALVAEGVNVTFTALHASHQALLGTALGAYYVVPYLGRMNDAQLDGLGEVFAMQEMVQALHSPVQVLVASLRQVSDVVALARRGVGVFALPAPLAEALLDNPLSIQAAADFETSVRAST